jgi:hypothetical protein
VGVPNGSFSTSDPAAFTGNQGGVKRAVPGTIETVAVAVSHRPASVRQEAHAVTSDLDADGVDVLAVRRAVGMALQKASPVPTMSIARSHLIAASRVLPR